mgnify:CR=1 FL=1
MVLNTSSRRNKILEVLKSSGQPVSANTLAEQCGVTRQIIVGDIAILRAASEPIVSTAKGYVFEPKGDETQYPYEGVIAVRHTADRLREELYTIVDFGGVVLNVTIDHPLYGLMVGKMHITSRYEVDLFIEKSAVFENAPLLSNLTDGIHIHTIGTRDKETFDLIRGVLTEKGIALS